MSFDLVDFNTDVIEASYKKAVLVDFWAEWCGPCQVLSPVLEEIFRERNDDFLFVKINTEVEAELSSKYEIRGIPNVKLFYKGEIINEFTGALPKDEINKWLDKALPKEYADKLLEATELLNQLKLEEAESLLIKLNETYRDKIDIEFNLAKSILLKKPDQAKTLLKQALDGSEYYNESKSLIDLINILQLEPELTNEKKIDKIILHSLGCMKTIQFEKALTSLIEAVELDKSYMNEAARKACIALFSFLGQSHPLSIKYRQRLSMAMY